MSDALVIPFPWVAITAKGWLSHSLHWCHLQAPLLHLLQENSYIKSIYIGSSYFLTISALLLQIRISRPAQPCFQYDPVNNSSYKTYRILESCGAVKKQMKPKVQAAPLRSKAFLPLRIYSWCSNCQTYNDPIIPQWKHKNRWSGKSGADICPNNTYQSQ